MEWKVELLTVFERISFPLPLNQVLELHVFLPATPVVFENASFSMEAFSKTCEQGFVYHLWKRLIEPVLVLKLTIACGEFPTSPWASAPVNW